MALFYRNEKGAHNSSTACRVPLSVAWCCFVLFCFCLFFVLVCFAVVTCFRTCSRLKLVFVYCQGTLLRSIRVVHTGICLWSPRCPSRTCTSLFATLTFFCCLVGLLFFRSANRTDCWGCFPKGRLQGSGSDSHSTSAAHGTPHEHTNKAEAKAQL